MDLRSIEYIYIVTPHQTGRFNPFRNFPRICHCTFLSFWLCYELLHINSGVCITCALGTSPRTQRFPSKVQGPDRSETSEGEILAFLGHRSDFASQSHRKTGGIHNRTSLNCWIWRCHLREHELNGMHSCQKGWKTWENYLDDHAPPRFGDGFVYLRSIHQMVSTKPGFGAPNSNLGPAAEALFCCLPPISSHNKTSHRMRKNKCNPFTSHFPSPLLSAAQC